MRATDVLLKQLDGINALIHGIADDLTDDEWTARAAPATNVLGFTLWHLPRTQDWAVQTAVRGVPEVIADGRWAGRGGLATPGIGVGVTLDEADAIARAVARTDLLAYADAVHQTIRGWVSALAADDLDRIPDVRAHEAPYPAYGLPGFRAEVDDMVGMPVWRYLLGPCIGHVRSHLGELDLAKQIVRGAAHAS